jgi:PAS domain-containing protein
VDEDDEDDDISQPNSSVSSTAAVARGEGANEGEHGRSDVVIRIKKGRKAQIDARKKELTSLESDFDLDYQEVFLASNVPQIIATPAGRFITTNEFFLKATGLTKQDAARLTIFSIVKPEKLSNLFQIVAEALRQDTVERERRSNSHETASSSSDGQSSGHTSGTSGSTNDEHGSDTDTWDYSAVTLPCIAFPPKGERKGFASTHHPNPLYMTVTLMRDPDPGKRCFHCSLTDCPGTNGQLGFVTPALLEMLFSETIEEEPQVDDANSGSGNDSESNSADEMGGKDEHDFDMMMDD